MNPKNLRLKPIALAALLLAAPVHAANLIPNDFSIGKVDFTVNGRVQQDFLLHADVPAEDQDGGELRRARLGLRAKWGDGWRAGISVDIDNNNNNNNNVNNGSLIIRDLSVEYTGLPVRFEAGRFQEPFGLANYGSSRSTVFLERPSPSQFGPDYGLGGSANYRGKRWGISVGAFTSGGGELGGDRPEDAVTGRITLTPLRGEASLLHLGAGGSIRKTDDARGLRFQGSPETVLIGGFTPRSPRVLTADSYSLYNGEAAFQRGPFLVQAEYVVANGEQGIGGDGWYVEASYALTGERRAYSTRYGNFGGIDPRRPLFGSGRRGLGALEVGARYSRTTLTDNGGDEGDIYGVALNWYPHEHVRLSVNYQRLSLDRAAQASRDTDIITSRIQLSF